MEGYSHLSEDERDQIGLLRAAGRSIGAIARHLGRAKTTISRELNRNAFRPAVTPVFAGDPGGPKIGTLGRNVFRGRQQFYWDASLFKNFPMRFISEDFAAQFRFTAFNVLNRVNRSRPNGDFGNTGDFGRDTSEQRRRQMEFSLKLIF